jgi:hypothetical protein
MLHNLYNKTVGVKRLGSVSGTHKEAWADVESGGNPIEVSCAIHPLEGSQQELLEGGFFNTFKMFCPTGTDIKIGDRVIDGSDTYTVKGLKTYGFAGSSSIQHLNLIIVKQA